MKTLDSGSPSPFGLLGAVLTAGLLALGGCGDKANNQTAGEKVDSALARTEQAASDAKAKAEASANSAGTALKEGVAETQAALKGAGTAVVGAVDDAAVTAEVSTGLAKDADLSALKINVDTKAGVVTLHGPAPSAAAKARAEQIAMAVKGVVSVDNQLDVKN